MKKILALLLILVLALSLFGCEQPDDSRLSGTGDTGSQILDTTRDTEADTTEADTTEADTTEAPTDPPETTEAPTEPETTRKPTQPKPTDPPATTEKPAEPETTKEPSKSQQIVDQAFQLSKGEQLSGTVTLTGTVISVTEVSSYYGNATFNIRVEGSDGTKTLLCYRVKPADSNAMEVAVGDTVTLTGTIQNYNGTIEFYPATYTNLSYDGTQDSTTSSTTGSQASSWPTRQLSSSVSVTKDGTYDSMEEVALYILTYGCLPDNYITKSEAGDLGWSGGSVERYAPGMCIGGDTFRNNEGRLPKKSGRRYYECDIDTLGASSRGAKRIVFSSDGLVFYTSDHYETFTQILGAS